jgi:hypothetical protein
MKVAIFWVVMCSLIYRYQCFRGMYFSALKMEAAGPSETLVSGCQSIWCYITEDRKLHSQHCENLKSQSEECWHRCCFVPMHPMASLLLQYCCKEGLIYPSMLYFVKQFHSTHWFFPANKNTVSFITMQLS